MKITLLETEFAVAKLPDLSRSDPAAAFFFLARTPDELSIVCPADTVPDNATKVEAGWRIFRVEGPLDFSLVGILAKLTGLLAERSIPVFAISTFDTDYVLVKADQADAAREVLAAGGWEVR